MATDSLDVLSTSTKVGVVLAVLIATGSVAAFVIGVGPFADAAGAEPIDQTPAESDVVVYTDMAIRDDPATRTLVNESLSTRSDEPFYGGPTSYDALVNETNRSSELDSSKMDEILVFGKYPPENASFDHTPYWGAIVYADWTADEVASALQSEMDNRSWTEATYNGHTVYKSEPESEFQDPTWFGVLDDGRFVFGTPEAVKGSVDVAAGDEQAADGELRAKYDELREDALVAYVVNVPNDRIPEEQVDQASERAPINYNVFTSVDWVSGAYYTSSDSVGFTTHMHATDADAAEDISDVTQGGISFASGTVSNETVKNGLRDIEVSRNEATVTVSYEKSVDRIQQLLAALDRLGV